MYNLFSRKQTNPHNLYHHLCSENIQQIVRVTDVTLNRKTCIRATDFLQTLWNIALVPGKWPEWTQNVATKIFVI